MSSIFIILIYLYEINNLIFVSRRSNPAEFSKHQLGYQTIHGNCSKRWGHVIASGRKTPEVGGKWKQYSGRISPVISGRFPPEKNKKLVGSNRRNSKAFRPEYCFQVPLSSEAFLPEPTSALWPGYLSMLREHVCGQHVLNISCSVNIYVRTWVHYICYQHITVTWTNSDSLCCM